MREPGSGFGRQWISLCITEIQIRKEGMWLMPFNIEPYIHISPEEIRVKIRNNEFNMPTAGMCQGYAQANLVVMPGIYADYFIEYAQNNPYACPILEVLKGTPKTKDMAEDGDITTDICEYYVYRNGALDDIVNDISGMWEQDFVGFLLGCSFSFEEALIKAGIEMRHLTQKCFVPMFKTNIKTKKAGPFEGPLVCTMRPMTPENAKLACEITRKFPYVHGTPIHIGSPEDIGIEDVMNPDYGDAVEIREGEVPVFWPCGVTPQAAVENAKLPLVLTHSPGHMFITDIKNTELNAFLESKGRRNDEKIDLERNT